MPSAPIPQKIVLIAGTRPNFIKAAPLFHALAARPDRFDPFVWVVSQHQAPELTDDILEDLALQGPKVGRLIAKGEGLGQRLGAIVDAVAAALAADSPDLVVVFGDVDTTLAGAIAAKRMQLPLAHVEAGLRSHDRKMPEELNRLMVDAIADLHLATSQDAVETLVAREGHRSAGVHFVGNLMIDSLLKTMDKVHGIELCGAFGVVPNGFALATFHRPSNVDAPSTLASLLDMLRDTARLLPVLLPLHPRTEAALRRHGLFDAASAIPGLKLLPSLRYRDFVSLLVHSRIALTDSGGLQEETSVLGLPCLTVRGNTERPVTVDQGSNRLVAPESAAQAVREALSSPRPLPARIAGWDGETAERICDVLASFLSGDPLA